MFARSRYFIPALVDSAVEVTLNTARIDRSQVFSGYEVSDWYSQDPLDERSAAEIAAPDGKGHSPSLTIIREQFDTKSSIIT